MTTICKRLLQNSMFEGISFSRILVSGRGIKYLKPPPNYDHITLPEIRKLPIVPKVPSYPHGIIPPKMKKLINLMRYPETVHNKLIHEQYGIQCVRGGQMKIAHFDLIRNMLHVDLDYKRMFAIWRVDAPWQARTKRPIGFTLGGGKGNIHHYVTPVSAQRIIIEVGGHGEYEEVEYLLKRVSDLMPFKARPVSHKMLIAEKLQEKQNAERNMNPYTYEYLIKNDMLGCRKYVKKPDYKHFGKHPL